jgi:hypothetical protein
LAECQGKTLGKIKGLPSVCQMILGKEDILSIVNAWHSAKLTIVNYKQLLTTLCRVSHFAESLTLGKAFFAECFALSKILVSHDIYSSGLTHATSSQWRDNRWHQTTHGSSRPSLNQSNRPPRWWCLSCACETYVVSNLRYLCLCGSSNTYVYETWSELVRFVVFVILMFVKNLWIFGFLWDIWSLLCMWWFYELCDVYVIYVLFV